MLAQYVIQAIDRRLGCTGNFLQLTMRAAAGSAGSADISVSVGRGDGCVAAWPGQ